MKELSNKTVEIRELTKFANSLILIDTRLERCQKHRAETIVIIAIAAVICGAESWNAIEDFGKSKESLFRDRLPRFDGIPSHDTFSRFFTALDPEKFEHAYRDWIHSIAGDYAGHIAIDGKTIRGAYESAEEKECRGSALKASDAGKYKLHVVSVFASDLGLSLGQLCTEEKENEITIIPLLLDKLCIKDNIVTIDAMGCQKKIAEKIIEQQGDYILIVKDNHPKLKKRIESSMKELIAKETTSRLDVYQTEEKGHGRIEKRSCYCCKEPLYLGGMGQEWAELSSFGYIENERYVIKENKFSIERRYFISSLPPDAKIILENNRKHWAIENNLHWQLDVNFHEDYGRKKNVAALNFSVLSKIALATLKHSKKKAPINRRRMMAGWDNDYLWELILQNL